jgi:hypothetical protein
MLRTLVVVLVLANLAFWAWTNGALEIIGMAPANEREPARLNLQVRPEAVRVLSPAAAASALRVASAPPLPPAVAPAVTCLEAGPFAAAEVMAAEDALAGASLAGARWARVSTSIPAQFAVVLGPFDNRDAMQKKRAELERLKQAADELDLPGTNSQLGLALGRYDSSAAADAALASLAKSGVRSAKVVTLRPAGSENRLRVEAATPAQAAALRTLSVPALGAGFVPCPSATTAAR